MDEADQWLAAHDPSHTASAYMGDPKEISVGGNIEIEQAIAKGGRLVEHGALGERLCDQCYRPFAPIKSDHQQCGETCRAKARKLYQREYKRDYMRQRRAA